MPLDGGHEAIGPWHVQQASAGCLEHLKRLEGISTDSIVTMTSRVAVVAVTYRFRHVWTPPHGVVGVAQRMISMMARQEWAKIFL